MSHDMSWPPILVILQTKTGNMQHVKHYIINYFAMALHGKQPYPPPHGSHPWQSFILQVKCSLDLPIVVIL